MAMDPTRFYRNLIFSLEKSFLQNQDEASVWRRVMTEISSKLKLEILFDCRFSETLKQYFKQIKEKFEGSQSYVKKIRYIDYLNRLFYGKSFTSKRQYQRIDKLAKEILQSPCIQWQNNLSYLKSASSLKEFRDDFLYRYCNLPQQEIEVLLDQIEEMAEGKQKLKTIYEKFFRNFLEVGTNLRIANFVQTFWSQWQSKTEMLSPDLILAIQKHLGGDVGRTTNQVQVNSALLHIAQENTFQNDSQVKQKLQNEVKIIQKALQKFSGLNILKDKKIELRLGKFGSIVSGFAGLDADLDLTILTNCYVNELQLLKIIYQFLKKQYQVGDRRSNGRRVLPQLISTAKTPLIAITINQRGQPEIKIDIIVNNILGILNSKFLNVYAGVRWIRNLGILVKMWGKNVGLIGKSNFSSYSMILMLIHYLIKSKKANAIMDARGRKPDTPHFKFKRMKVSEIEQFDVYYNFKTKSEDVAANERVNYLEILLGFMRYYGQQMERDNDSNEKNKIITVDLSTDCQIDKETAITIKDPFDKPHNPGRLKKQNLSFMVAKFKEAHEILTRGDVQRVKDLFSKY